MKNIVRILSLLVAVGAVIVLLDSNFEMGKDFSNLAKNVSALLTMNTLPLISIGLCSYCMERNDTNYFTRIVPFLMSIPILLSVFITFIELGSGATKVISNIISFMSTTYLFATVISLLFIVKPNNIISKGVKFVAYAAIAINVILAIYIQVKAYMVETLPNVYEYDRYGGFNFAELGETEKVASKIYSASIIIEEFSIILLFMTNYGFSTRNDIEVENLDYNALKEKAIEVSEAQMKGAYEKDNQKQQEPVSPLQEEVKGLMNITNQLGNDSNVGKVEHAAREVNIVGASVEDFMPLSSGPVVNETLKQNEPPQQVQRQVQQQQPQVPPVNNTGINQQPMQTGQNMNMQMVQQGQMQVQQPIVNQQQVQQQPQVQQTVAPQIQPQQPVANQQVQQSQQEQNANTHKFL